MFRVNYLLKLNHILAHPRVFLGSSRITRVQSAAKQTDKSTLRHLQKYVNRTCDHSMINRPHVNVYFSLLNSEYLPAFEYSSFKKIQLWLVLVAQGMYQWYNKD